MARSKPWADKALDVRVQWERYWANVRRESIDNELLQSKDHPCAGRFHAYDSDFLAIGADNGFYFSRSSCGGGSFNHGEVAWVSDDEVILAPRIDIRIFSSPERLIRVAWLGRTFLVEPDSMIELANDVNSGSVWPVLHYLMRADDAELDPDAPLQVPATWQRYFLSDPLQLHVVAADDWVMEETDWGYCRFVCQATLSQDLDRGAFPGMLLYPAASPPYATAEILTAEQSTVVARVELDSDDGGLTPIAPGSVYSTRKEGAGDLQEVQWSIRNLRERAALESRDNRQE